MCCLKPPHITTSARPALAITREESQRERTVGRAYEPAAGVRVTKVRDESPKPSAQSVKPAHRPEQLPP